MYTKILTTCVTWLLASQSFKSIIVHWKAEEESGRNLGTAHNTVSRTTHGSWPAIYNPLHVPVIKKHLSAAGIHQSHHITITYNNWPNRRTA